MMPESIHKTISLRHILRDVQQIRIGSIMQQVAGMHRLYADGLVGLVFHASNPTVRFNGRQCEALFLYGQTVKPMEITYQGNLDMIVFLFEPYAIRYLFGIHAAELTDECLDFDCVSKSLKQMMVRAVGNAARIALVLDFLLKAEADLSFKTDQRIIQATTSIEKEKGNIALSTLHKELYITERTFERQFLKTVGVTPATFVQICRFNNAIRHLQSGNYTSLTSLAHRAGYADQSHFIRQFKTFTSLTPSEYLQSLQHPSITEAG